MNEKDVGCIGLGVGIGLLMGIVAYEFTPKVESYMEVTCYGDSQVRKVIANNVVITAGMGGRGTLLTVTHENPRYIENVSGDMFCGIALEEKAT